MELSGKLETCQRVEMYANVCKFVAQPVDFTVTLCAPAPDLAYCLGHENTVNFINYTNDIDRITYLIQ